MRNQANGGITGPSQQDAPYYSPQQNAQVDDSLLHSLQEGGYIFYARHAEATVGRDQVNHNFQDCSTQRNLSAIGRQDAVTYGEALRNLGIPVMTPVITSPFCRNIETAQLAFGQQNIQVDPFWIQVYRLGVLRPAEQASIINYLNSMFEIQPPAGTNKVIIGHSFPRGIGFGRIPNMGTIIMRPRGRGNGYEVVARLTLRDLRNLDE